jgi:hypothetical protein
MYYVNNKGMNFQSFNLKSLKQAFLAACPVIGPHAGIEVDLMLAGKKPLTWIPVFSDQANFADWRVMKMHEDRLRLDAAVEQGLLIAKDVTAFAGDPEKAFPVRHYALPSEKRRLEMLVAFNQCAMNDQDVSQADLKEDVGRYLGYRRRDVLFFNHIVNSPFIPGPIKTWIIDANAPCQRARRDQLLREAGVDVEAWHEHARALAHTNA